MSQEIKERNITLLLSDEDCDALAKKCGEAGLSVSQLLHNFVGDLIDARFSNGSDERIFANQWFDRCRSSSFPENTLLEHLLLNGYDPEDYLYALDEIKDCESAKEGYAVHPEEYDEEAMSFVDDDIIDCQRQIFCMMEDWHPESEPDMDEQQLIIKEWVKERNALLG